MGARAPALPTNRHGPPELRQLQLSERTKVDHHQVDPQGADLNPL